MKNNIEIIKVNINELLNKTNGATIPYYQRNYNWEAEEIERLFYDLLANKSSEYYCGSIVIQNHLLSEKEIVDGQQRISTFLIILRYLKNYMKINNINDEFFNISEYQIKSNNLTDKEILQELIFANNEKELDKVCEKYKKSRYIANFMFVNNYFKDKSSKEIEKFISIFKNMVCALVIVSKEYDEYRLFTNINSTGLPLNAFDLVKNFIFSKMELNEKQIKEKLKIFNQISNYLEVDQNTNNPLDNKKKNANLNELIRLFNAYETGVFDNKSEATMLFRKLEKIYLDTYYKNIDKLFENFIEFGIYYKFIKTQLNSEKYNFYKSMRIIELQFNTYITLVIDIIKNNSSYNKYSLEIDIDSNQEKEIEKSLLVIEAYSLFRTYTNMRSNDLSRFIPTLVKKIEINNQKFSYAASLLKVLYFDQKDNETNTIMPTKEKFLKALIDATDIYNNKKKNTEKLLIRIDEYLNEKTNKKNTTKYQKLNIEHILPQNYEKWVSADPNLDKNEIDDYVNSLGNLTILPEKLNIELQNDVFEIKKEKLLEKGTFIINNYLNKKTYWNINSIKERMKSLIKTIDVIYNLNDLFLELNEPIENSDIDWLVENRNTRKLVDDEIYWKKLKEHSNWLKIKITYQKIYDAIYEYCVRNKTKKWISNIVFNIPLKIDGSLKDRGYIIWGLFNILKLDKIHQSKSKEWLENFIKENENLINEIIYYCY